MLQELKIPGIYLGIGLAVTLVAVVLQNVPVLPLILCVVAGAFMGWRITLAHGGRPTLLGLIALFGLTYSTTLSQSLRSNPDVSFGRLMAFTVVAGTLLGAVVGSFKREIDRQRAKRTQSLEP